MFILRPGKQETNRISRSCDALSYQLRWVKGFFKFYLVSLLFFK